MTPQSHTPRGRGRTRAVLCRALLALRGPVSRPAAPARLDCRELRTELGIVAAFAAAATALALTAGAGHAPRPVEALVLGVLLMAMLAVQFDVATGRTSPVELVFVPMLILLPAGWVPVVVAAVHVARALVIAVLRRRPAIGVLLAAGDAWYAIGPAVVIALTAPGTPSWVDAPAYLAALAAQIAVDSAVTTVRVRVGLRLPIRPELAAMAWVYLVDVLLAPIGMLAALAAARSVTIVALVVPLAALLVVFARERRGRIENALSLSRAAAESEQRLQALVQHASDLILIVERDGTIRNLTGAVRQLFGPDWQEAAGTMLLDHAHLADRSLVAAVLTDAAARPRGESSEGEWRMRRPDGSWRHVEGIATNLLDEDRIGALVVTVRDVHERRAFEDALRHRAFHDQLTGLPNRALFYDRVEHALNQRNDRLVALVFIDLDSFKDFNDRLGHAAGDELLVEFAARLRACVRAADTPARLGGDEFGVLLEDVGGPNEPVQVAERIVAALAEPLAVAGERLTVNASIGIVVSSLEDDAPDELLRRADLAMYTAKRDGKGRWELYRPGLERPAEEEDTPRVARVTWVASTDEQREEILSLLDRPGAIRPVFQPIMDLRTGEVAGYEALSRFDTPVNRPPNVWFDQAHRCGLGYRLEALAFQLALAAPDRPPGVHLSVNLSLSALASDEVRAVLPERLDGVIIEILENELATDKADVQEAMALVRERGARLAVDDAGSGYAGLQHVMRLEPDVIKLDRALVDGVHEDPVKAALIEAFVRYARRIDASICAEGIESLEDLALLADVDVAYGQGWAIGRPAAPWAPVAPDAAARCRDRTRAALAAPSAGADGDALEQLAHTLSQVTSADAVAAALEPVATELRADLVVISECSGDRLVPAGFLAGGAVTNPVIEPVLTCDALADGAVEVVDGARGADPLALAELHGRGFGSLLAIPIVVDGRPAGALELYAVDARRWSRFDLRRARVAAGHVGAVLARLRAEVGAAVR